MDDDAWVPGTCEACGAKLADNTQATRDAHYSLGHYKLSGGEPYGEVYKFSGQVVPMPNADDMAISRALTDWIYNGD